MTKFSGVYYIPSAINEKVAEVIKEQLFEVPFQPAEVEDSTVNEKIRVSNIHWLNTDHWVAGMMAHFINKANISIFEYDLHAWADKIQYTVYDGHGTKYTWHNDHQPSTYYKNMWRKLSISLCLSSDYEGGELQVMTYQNCMETYKLKCGDAVIFSSDAMHRVRPIRSGKRISLVGWMAGPKFK